MEEFYNIFLPLNPDEVGVVSVPTTEEIRDKSYNRMHSFLDSRGYGMTYKMQKCSDGIEYEITEIREPKAFGFFYFFYFLKFLLYECGNEKQQIITPLYIISVWNTPCGFSHKSLNCKQQNKKEKGTKK